MSTQPESEPPLSTLGAGGLLAISLVILQGLLTLYPLNITASISVYTLSFSIPILSSKILINTLRSRRLRNNPPVIQQSTKTPVSETFLFFMGIITTIIGIVAALWHINCIAAIIFFISTLCAITLYLRALKA